MVPKDRADFPASQNPRFGATMERIAMLPRRIIPIIICTMLCFLGVYTWNQRTAQLDSLSAGMGLEATGSVMRLLDDVKGSISSFWENYVDLRGVKERNDALEERVQLLEKMLADKAEESAELIRLRRLIHLDVPEGWSVLGARVLAWRMGPNAALNTIMLSNGYFTGATPGTPVASWDGIVGRVLKAGPSTSVVLLLTDTGSRISVITSEGRVQGMLSGGGPGQPLELRFVRQNSPVRVGELLITSGVDSAYPKGVPVARVTAISTGGTSRSGAALLEIQAEPLVDLLKLEEVLLLQRPEGAVAPESDAVYTRRPLLLEQPENVEEGPLGAGRSLP